MEGMALLLEEEKGVSLINANVNPNDNYIMNKIKAVLRGMWQFASFLFWPQRNKRCLYDADTANAYDNDK